MHHSWQAWQQETGAAAGSGNWEAAPSTISTKHREQNKSGRGYELSNPRPVMSFLQQVWATFLSSTTNWGLHVQIPEPVGDICHENPHTSESLIRVLLSKYSPSARLDLISVVSVMKDCKSPVTFGQGGPITQEIQTQSTKSLLKLAQRCLCYPYCWRSREHGPNTDISLPGERETASFSLQFSYGKTLDTRAI